MNSIPLAPYYAPAEELPAALPTQQPRRLQKLHRHGADSGCYLDTTWTTLSRVQKQAVAAQLKGYLTELRNLPSPGGYCSLDHKPLRADFFWTGSGENSLGLDGPFDTEAELNQVFIQQYNGSVWSSENAGLHARALPTIFRDHPPTFTHGDLLQKNIIFDPQTEKATLIDWEFAGWYPSYWEYVIATYGCGHFKDDWSEWLESMLDVYRVEFAWLRMMVDELWG